MPELGGWPSLCPWPAPQVSATSQPVLLAELARIERQLEPGAALEPLGPRRARAVRGSGQGLRG